MDANQQTNEGCGMCIHSGVFFFPFFSCQEYFFFGRKIGLNIIKFREFRFKECHVSSDINVDDYERRNEVREGRGVKKRR